MFGFYALILAFLLLYRYFHNNNDHLEERFPSLDNHVDENSALLPKANRAIEDKADDHDDGIGFHSGDLAMIEVPHMIVNEPMSAAFAAGELETEFATTRASTRYLVYRYKLYSFYF